MTQHIAMGLLFFDESAATDASWDNMPTMQQTGDAKEQASDADLQPAEEPAQTDTEPVTTEDGKQQPQGDEAKDPTSEDLEKEYKELVKGKFKEQYRKATQDLIDKRFKQTKSLEKYKSNTEPLLATLAEKLHVDVNDTAALQSAIADIGVNYDDLAFQNGTTPEFERQKAEVERQKAKLAAQENTKQAEADAEHAEEETKARIAQELDDFAKLYPDVDIRDELEESDAMREKLSKGYSLIDAYRATHYDDITKKMITDAIAQTKTAVVNDIKANGLRAHENAAKAQTGTQTKTDITNLSDTDMEKLWKAFGTGRQGDILRH